MKEIYNLSQLVKIEVIAKEELIHYKYNKAFKLFGLTLQKEGYYYFGKLYYTEKELVNETSLISDGKKLFRKPCVKLYFTNEYVTTVKYFPNFAMANKFGHELATENFTSKLEIKE